jgi:hypothetical protein
MILCLDTWLEVGLESLPFEIGCCVLMLRRVVLLDELLFC